MTPEPVFDQTPFIAEAERRLDAAATEPYGVNDLVAQLLAEVAQVRQGRDALCARELNAFVAGWNAAKADTAAADDEDVADAPDVAWSDYQRHGDVGKRSAVRECGCSIYEPCPDHPEPGAASKETSGDGTTR